MEPSDRTTRTAQEQAIAVLDAVLADAELPTRRLAADHRGLSCEVGGWPLDVGVCVQDGMLRAQAEVCGHGQVDPHDLLHDHRKRPFARFSHADGGAVWVEAELPIMAATPALVDAMLGALLEAAAVARERARVATGR
jgi:hypothetical protein